MEVFQEYLKAIQNPEHKKRTEEVFLYIQKNYPDLVPKIAWNQPMFTHHGTFIIGFSISKQHLGVTPEQVGIQHFSKEITQAGYEQSKMIFRIKWSDEVNYSLLKAIIEYNIDDKKDCKAFWRKNLA